VEFQKDQMKVKSNDKIKDNEKESNEEKSQSRIRDPSRLSDAKEGFYENSFLEDEKAAENSSVKNSNSGVKSKPFSNKRRSQESAFSKEESQRIYENTENDQ